MAHHGPLRQQIYDIAKTQIFAAKGGENLTSIGSGDVAALFRLYDKLFFGGEIIERLKETSSTIKFIVTPDTTGTTSECTVKGGCMYELSISPRVIATLFASNPKGVGTAAGVGCTNRLECLLLIFEHELVHLIMMLWGVGDLPPHGEAYQCLANRFFGHTRFDHDLGMIVDKHTIAPSRFYGYTNFSNSCYIDSLLTTIFLNKNNFWRRGVFESDINAAVYHRGVCDITSHIDTPEKIRDMAKAVREQLANDLVEIVEKKKVSMCSSVRDLFAQCLPAMKYRGSWVMFNSGATYNLLAELFPNLKILIPKQISIGSELNARVQNLASVSMSDYMLQEDTSQDSYTIIEWDKVSSPILVFQNTLAPRIKRLNATGEEITMTRGASAGTLLRVTVNKVRAFGLEILGDYVLVGVVMVRGVPRNGEGGSHYNSYYLSSTGWMFYDDMGIHRHIPSPPQDIWEERGGSLPELYFYVRKEIL
jgi:hypothetical protein